jgi:hypothetical protein
MPSGLPKACHGWHDIQRNCWKMKRIFAIIIIIAAGCSDHENKMTPASPHSGNESAINNLVDSFESDYASAASARAKDVVMSNYQVKTDKFLSKHYLNHMRVHIDSVIINHLTIDTRFHAGKNLMFTSSTQFRRPMPAKEDSLFHFMKGLRQNTDTNIDFMYIGKFELHRPDDKLNPALIVNAYPLSYQVHGGK